MNSALDSYFEDHKRWAAEARALRAILHDCGLQEEKKWYQPCYTIDGKNIVILQRVKDFLALAFFKGALLKDPEGILEKPGENSNFGRRIPFTSVDQISGMDSTIRAYIAEAIAAEKAGLKVERPEAPALVEELQHKLDEDPELKAAFEALTPGRQRGYNLYFSGAKQSATRVSRVEKYREKILQGKGFHD